jgi:hypothetical protein
MKFNKPCDEEKALKIALRILLGAATIITAIACSITISREYNKEKESQPPVSSCCCCCCCQEKECDHAGMVVRGEWFKVGSEK